MVQAKTSKTTQKGHWKTRSIFWNLPYWEHLFVRYCFDVKHIEKNVCDNIIKTLLNIWQMKDDVKARKNMVEMVIQDKLAPQELGK